MLKTVNIKRSQLNDRFEPRYHFHKNIHSQTYQKFGFENIKEICSLKSGTTPENFDEKKSPTDVHFIKSADVKRFNINYNTLSYISEEINTGQKNSVIKPFDVLITNTGKYLGFTSLFTEKLPLANINQNIIRIRFKENIETKITPYFITAFLNSKFGQIEIQSLLTLTGQKYLNMSKFRKLNIPKIDVKLIKETTEKLQTAYQYEDEAISLIESSRQDFYSFLNIEFKKIKQPKSFSVNLNSFRTDDLWTPQYSSPLYIETLNKIRAKHKMLPLGKLVAMKKGNEVGSENYIDFMDAKKTDVPFIRTTDLVNYECDSYPDFVVPIEIYNELSQNLQTDDVLFTKDGKIGMCGMLTSADRVITASGILRVRLKKTAVENYKISPEYMFIILSTKEIGYYPAIRRTVVASTIPHLREDRIKDIEIPILPETDIKTISKKVKKAFELKTEKKKIIAEVIRKLDKYLGEET